MPKKSGVCPKFSPRPDLLGEAATLNASYTASSQGTCKETDGTVVCKPSTLGTSGSASITIVVKPSDGVITNTAYVTAKEADSNLANNSATQSTTVSVDSNASPTVTHPSALFVRCDLSQRFFS